MLSTILLALALMLAGPTVLRADEEAGGDSNLSVDILPRYCRDPCRIDVRVRLEPHETDRALEIEADSGEFFRGSFVQLDGLEEPAVHRVTLYTPPPGNYTVRVTLRRTTGIETRLSDSFRVLGMPDP